MYTNAPGSQERNRTCRDQSSVDRDRTGEEKKIPKGRLDHPTIGVWSHESGFHQGQIHRNSMRCRSWPLASMGCISISSSSISREGILKRDRLEGTELPGQRFSRFRPMSSGDIDAESCRSALRKELQKRKKEKERKAPVGINN